MDRQVSKGVVHHLQDMHGNAQPAGYPVGFIQHNLTFVDAVNRHQQAARWLRGMPC